MTPKLTPEEKPAQLTERRQPRDVIARFNTPLGCVENCPGCLEKADRIIAALASNGYEIVTTQSLRVERQKALEEAATVAENWESPLRPGTPARLSGQQEAKLAIAEEIRSLLHPSQEPGEEHGQW